MKAVLFDTETSGLVRNRTLKLDSQPEIIELYACVANLKTGKIAKEYDTLIKPSKALSDTPAPGDKKTITQITGIDNAMLKDAKPFKDHAKAIMKILSAAPIVIAHNLSFDAEMIEIELERCGIKDFKWSRKVCTVEQTLHMKGFRLSMSALHQELFGEPFAGAHRAKADVAALLRCAVELHKRDII